MSQSTSSNGASWRSIAVASGACAAFNGVFAKLTTDERTSNWASFLATQFGLGISAGAIEFIARTFVFVLYFFLSSAMWALFTRALALSPSAVKVNVINTAANFIITALLGALIFGESLPLLWWAGATLLILGSVIIGTREGTAEARPKEE